MTVRNGNHAFFRNRDDEGAVILQRRYNPVGPNGKYICTIPDQNGVMTKLYVGLYSDLGRIEEGGIVVCEEDGSSVCGEGGVISVWRERSPCVRREGS